MDVTKWKVSDQEEQETHRDELEADGFNRLYLTVVDGNHSCSIWSWGATQKLANEQAGLIASATDLLDELILARDTIYSLQGAMTGEFFKEQIERIDVAISKATGK